MAVRKHEPSGGMACVAPARRSLAGLGYERQRSGDPYRSSRVTSLPKSPKPGVIGHRRSAEKPLTKLLHLRNAHLRRCPGQGDAYATDHDWKGGPARARDVRRGRTAIGVMHYERWQLPCFFPQQGASFLNPSAAKLYPPASTPSHDRDFIKSGRQHQGWIAT